MNTEKQVIIEARRSFVGGKPQRTIARKAIVADGSVMWVVTDGRKVIRIRGDIPLN